MKELKSHFLTKGEQQLFVMEPNNQKSAALDFLVTKIRSNKSVFLDWLHQYGGILFRGFEVDAESDFQKVFQSFSDRSFMDYKDGNSPRSKLTSNIYTSTEYPKAFRITLHNEMSYTRKWPEKIFFYCHTPAGTGGETPIIDSRYLLKLLDSEMVGDFRDKQVKYTRYLVGKKGFGKTWSETYETSERSEIERILTQNGNQFFWEDNNLAISQIGPGTAIHPITGEEVWFNQANQFHPSSLSDDIYHMLKLLNADNPHRYPHYALFGDDTEISEGQLREITEICFYNSIVFKWQKGDVLMLDNMLMAHGRFPYEGERKILVSMS